MTPKRKPQTQQIVRFHVSWVDGEIVVPHIKDMPVSALVPMARHDFGPLIAWLPDKIGELVEDSTVRELEEFVGAWVKAGEEVDALAEQATSLVSWLWGKRE